MSQSLMDCWSALKQGACYYRSKQLLSSWAQGTGQFNTTTQQIGSTHRNLLNVETLLAEEKLKKSMSYSALYFQCLTTDIFLTIAHEQVKPNIALFKCFKRLEWNALRAYRGDTAMLIGSQVNTGPKSQMPISIDDTRINLLNLNSI